MAPEGPQSDLVQVPGFPAPPGAVVEWLTLGDGVKLRTARWILPDAQTHGTVLLAQGRTEFIEKYSMDFIEKLYAFLDEQHFQFKSFMAAYKFYSQYALKNNAGTEYLETYEYRNLGSSIQIDKFEKR